MVGVHLANDLQSVITTTDNIVVAGEEIVYDVTYFNTLAGGDPDAWLTIVVPSNTSLLTSTFSGGSLS